MRGLVLVAALSLVGAAAGCAGEPLPVSVAPDDPSNPRAAEAPGAPTAAPSEAPPASAPDAAPPPGHHHHAAPAASGPTAS